MGISFKLVSFIDVMGSVLLMSEGKCKGKGNCRLSIVSEDESKLICINSTDGYNSVRNSSKTQDIHEGW